MDSEYIGRVRIGRDLLAVLCALDFSRFLSASAGTRPVFGGAAFLLFACYTLVFYRPLIVSARMALNGRDGPTYPELWFNVLWRPMIPPSFLPWLLALCAGGLGIAMMLL